MENKGKMLLGNTVKFAEVALGLVPEAPNAVDVVFTGGKELGVVGPQIFIYPASKEIPPVLRAQRLCL
jgi:hypothetical protein